jgi:hypothetical protein
MLKLQTLLNPYFTPTRWANEPARRSNAPSLAALRKRAARHGVTIDRERDAYGWGYWLNGTGWDDGNFCADRDELSAAITEIERTAR